MSIASTSAEPPPPGARHLLVVPESLSAEPDGRAGRRPSFAYRQVLDAVAETAVAGDRVYLAPANSFGGPLTEEQVAWEYLRARAPALAVFCPGINLGDYRPDGTYVDTWGNAVRLARLVDPRAAAFELFVGYLHAPRARWCFVRAGFRIACVHPVRYRVGPEPIVQRTIYYRWPRIHRVYEALALVRDRLRYG